MQTPAEVGLVKNGPTWSVPPHLAEGIRAQSLSGRHHAYHQLAQLVYSSAAAKRPAASAGRLSDKGFDTVAGVLPAELCHKLSAQTTTWIDRSAAEIEAHLARKVFSFTPPAREHIQNVLMTADIVRELMPAIRRVLARPVTDLCECFLQSHFKINSLRVYRAMPNDRPEVSFRWHLDAAPPTQLHVFVYLTDPGPNGEGGCTEFLPRNVTAQLNRSGYAYKPIQDRAIDLDEIDGGAAFKPLVERPLPGLGGAMIFTPGTALHRGIPPRTSYRDALLLVLLPSLDPWPIALAAHGSEMFLDRSIGYLPVDDDPIAP